MPDVYSVITTVEPAVVADGARLLKIGCGTGAIARVLRARAGGPQSSTATTRRSA